MSRYIPTTASIRAYPTGGNTAWSQFCWLKAADLMSNDDKFYMYVGQTGPVVMKSKPTAFELQVNWGASASLPVPNNYDGVWIPCMVTYNGSYATMYLADLGGVGYSIPNGAVMDRAQFHHDSNIDTSYGEMCVWDVVLDANDWAALIDTSVGGEAPNPTTIKPGNIITYLSARTDNNTSEFGSQPLTWSLQGELSADNPPVTPLATAGPRYVGPDTLASKIGSTAPLETSTWWTDVVGTLTYSGDLPTGLSIDPSTGIISGATTSSESYDATLTVVDSDDVDSPGNGSITWTIAPYQIQYEGPNHLEDADGEAINSSDLNYSVFAGTLAQLTAGQSPLVEAATQTVSGGVLTITLPDSVVTSEEYTTMFEILDVPDDSEGNPVVPIAALPATGV